jgi:hypothetical protein
MGLETASIYDNKKEVRDMCKREENVFQAYSSLGTGSLNLVDTKLFKMLASKMGLNGVQELCRQALHPVPAPGGARHLPAGQWDAPDFQQWRDMF